MHRLNFSRIKFRVETNNLRKNNTDTPIYFIQNDLYIHEGRQFYYFQIYLRFKNI